MDSSGSCKQIDSISIDGTSYESLAAWARTNIDSIIVAIINKTALTDAQKQFLNQSSIPLYNLLRNDLLIRGNSELTDDSRETIISNYVKPVCTGYAHSMIRDLLTDIRTTLASVGAVTASQSKDTSDCAAGLQNKATVILESIRDRVNARMAEYSTDYHSAVLEDIALTLKSAEIQKLSSDVNTTLEGDDDGED